MATIDIETELAEEVLTKLKTLAEKIGNVFDRETMDVSGELSKSIIYEVKLFGMVIGIKVFSTLDYAIFIDEGRKPGRMPPIEPLLRWVRLNGIAERYSVKKHRRNGSKLSQYNEENKAAWGIAKVIAKHGTSGIHFFDMALKQALPKIERELKGLNFS